MAGQPARCVIAADAFQPQIGAAFVGGHIRRADAEYHVLAVRRRHRRADPMQAQHIFYREWRRAGGCGNRRAEQATGDSQR